MEHGAHPEGTRIVDATVGRRGDLAGRELPLETLAIRLLSLEVHPLGQLVLPGGQDALVDECLDVVQVAVRVLVRRLDAGVVGAEAAAADRLEGQLAGEAEALDGPHDRLGIDPGVDEGPERHVAGDPAETVEVGDAHARPPC